MCPVSRRKVTGLQGSQVLARLSEGLGGHERREGVGLRKVGRPQAPREPFEKAPCGPGQQVARLSPRTRATRHALWCLSLCGSRVSCRLCFCLSCGRGAPCTSWGRRDMPSVRTLVSSRPFLPPAAYRAAVTSRSEALGSEARTASSAPRVGSRTAGDQALGPTRRVRRAEPCPACRQPPRGQVQGEAPTSRGAAPATWASAGKPVGAGRARTCGEKSPPVRLRPRPAAPREAVRVGGPARPSAPRPPRLCRGRPGARGPLAVCFGAKEMLARRVRPSDAAGHGAGGPRAAPPVAPLAAFQREPFKAVREA